MHLFSVATVFLVLTLVGVEFSVSAFVNPAAWRLDPQPQLRMVSRVAAVLGKMMPVWYPLCAVLLIVQTWCFRHRAGFALLLAATVVWALASVASILFLVPLNNRVVAGVADWQQIHREWDRRHRVRIVALAVAAVLLTYAVVG